MKKTLHQLAIRMGWYRDITEGIPLNICKTVFGVYFFEGCYTPTPLGELVESLYEWGFRDGKTVSIYKPKRGEWKTRKDGLKRYRRVSVLREGWATESEFIGDMEMVILPPPAPWAPYDEAEASVYWDKVGNAEPD